ncbi:MAG TPA: conjugal transfer protein TraR [Ignavibacteria bacterium]|nr:conjugal transfer protein TraR [Ignavibacteria bacterium]
MAKTKSGIKDKKVLPKKVVSTKSKKTVLKTVSKKINTASVKKSSVQKKSTPKTVERVKASAFSGKKNLNEKAEIPVKKIKKFKPNKKTRYSKAELKHFRDIILLERKAIFESAKANMEALVDKESGEYKGDNLSYSSHMAEQGTDEMEREKNYLFVQRDEKYLGYLQDALMRIDQGTYGICVDCRDEPKNLCRTCPLIVKERLELVPITQHCIECKNLRG